MQIILLVRAPRHGSPIRLHQLVGGFGAAQTTADVLLLKRPQLVGGEDRGLALLHHGDIQHQPAVLQTFLSSQTRAVHRNNTAT